MFWPCCHGHCHLLPGPALAIRRTTKMTRSLISSPSCARDRGASAQSLGNRATTRSDVWWWWVGYGGTKRSRKGGTRMTRMTRGGKGGLLWWWRVYRFYRTQSLWMHTCHSLPAESGQPQQMWNQRIPTVLDIAIDSSVAREVKRKLMTILPSAKIDWSWLPSISVPPLTFW